MIPPSRIISATSICAWGGKPRPASNGRARVRSTPIRTNSSKLRRSSQRDLRSSNPQRRLSRRCRRNPARRPARSPRPRPASPLRRRPLHRCCRPTARLQAWRYLQRSAQALQAQRLDQRSRHHRHSRKLARRRQALGAWQHHCRDGGGGSRQRRRFSRQARPPAQAGREVGASGSCRPGRRTVVCELEPRRSLTRQQRSRMRRPAGERGKAARLKPQSARHADAVGRGGRAKPVANAISRPATFGRIAIRTRRKLKISSGVTFRPNHVASRQAACSCGSAALMLATFGTGSAIALASAPNATRSSASRSRQRGPRIAHSASRAFAAAVAASCAAAILSSCCLPSLDDIAIPACRSAAVSLV